MQLQHILVPLDFSADAEHALEYAINLARTVGARLTLFHVMQPFPLAGVPMGVPLPATYLQASEAALQQAMETALGRVTASGVAGESRMVYGVPWQEVLEAAERQAVDLIIMGTRGRTGLAHVLLGSVAEKVVRLAPCAVLVVPHRA
ncbi:MAG: universal stress protein [Candidatus Tectimicrobiota bacterium]